MRRADDAPPVCYVVPCMFNSTPKKASVIAGQPLSDVEAALVERVLRMDGGYALDFSDRTIKLFFGEFGVQILSDEYADGPTGGKANRVRSFLRKTKAPLVGQVMLALLNHGIETEFSDREDNSPRPGPPEVAAFRKLAARFGGNVAAWSAGAPKSSTPTPTLIPSSAHPVAYAPTPQVDLAKVLGERIPGVASVPRPAPLPAPPTFAPAPPGAPTLTGAHPKSKSGRRFRVGLSFAGEKRPFIHGVAHPLARVFGTEAILYDKFHEAELARPDLGIYLPNLYNKDADLVVVVVCPDYDRKGWTGLEWRAIHDLLRQRKNEEVMLCRFGFATVDGLFGTSGWVELDDKTPEETARLILERLAINEGLPRNTYSAPFVPPLALSPAPPVGATSTTYDDSDIVSILETWWESRSRAEQFSVIDVEDVDKALGLPAGSTSKHLPTVAAGEFGWVKVRRRGSRTILFYEDLPF